jgi:hypothetical protein
VRVPAGTNEITQVKVLLDSVSARDGDRVVVTMDAAHAQRETAEYLAGERGFDYVLTCKGNQPALLESIFDKVALLLRTTRGHLVDERGHGRIKQWSTWIIDADGIDFPRVSDSLYSSRCLRSRWTTSQQRIRLDHHQCHTERARAADLHDHVRNHWG